MDTVEESGKKKIERLQKFEYILSVSENIDINLLLIEILYKNIDIEDSDFLIEASYYGHKLPEKIVRSLYNFKHKENHYGLFLIKGFKLLNENGDFHQLKDIVGLTPLTQFDDPNNRNIKKINLFNILLNSILGDVFGWSSQHNGRIINNILPIKGNESEQLSSGSKVVLEWHTEEAFHLFKPDFLSLMCVRNDDNIPTTVCSICDLDLPIPIKKILFQKRFIFLTDKNFKSISKDDTNLASVLYGDFDFPCLCLDPAFMEVQVNDIEAKSALDYIIKEVNIKIMEVSLESGDICIFDNQRVVHGRKPFIAKYDGTDRWLKRVIITRDIKKSRVAREFDTSRVINTN